MKLCVASATASEEYRFNRPYKMADHGSFGNGINWVEDHIEYRKLYHVVIEALTGFAQLYIDGSSKFTFLSCLTRRPIHNLEDLNCTPTLSITDAGVTCPDTSSRNLLASPKQRTPSTIGR